MFFPIRLAGILAMLIFLTTACQKDPTPKPPADAPFEVLIDNDFNELQAQYVVFLSGSDGKVLAFRTVPGSDTIHLQVPGVRTTDRLDCTVVRLTTLEAQGSGVTDTSLYLRTYTQLASGETIRLQSLDYRRNTALNLTLTNLTSLDTIIVPDGLTFVRPQPANNFTGLYQVLHTGKMWVRLKVNGEPFWRYLFFDFVNSDVVEVSADVALLPQILTAPKKIVMPFTASWQYKVDGVVDTAGRQFLALGDLFRAPGGATPAFGGLDVFEPTTHFYQGYRISAKGTGVAPGGYTYASDGFYNDVPGSLPLPDFDLEPTTAATNRFIGVKCVGDFDLLAMTRSRSGNPNVTWEVLTQPANGILTYRLPDVPGDLGQRFLPLKNYAFGNSVVVRAEKYERLTGYEAVVRQMLRNDDPLWQAKAGYVSREEAQ